MSTCDMGYEHADPEPEPIIQAVEETVAADVEVAKIEADRDVTIAKIAAKAEESHDETEVEVLRGEVRVLREMVERMAPEPEPEPEPVPVVVNDAPAEPVPDVPAPPAAEAPAHRPSKSKSGMFGF